MQMDQYLYMDFSFLNSRNMCYYIVCDINNIGGVFYNYS